MSNLVEGVQWTPLVSSAEWNSLDEAVAGFHDGIVKEAQMTGGDFVNQDEEVVYRGFPVLWVLVQLQGDPSSIELLIEGVREYSFSYSAERSLIWSINSEEVSLEFLNCKVVARCISYRTSGTSKLGVGPFDVPTLEDSFE